MHDVAVVGAGPAGGMAAWRLAEGGLDVVVLERRAQVGVPVMCGEVVSRFALENNGIKVSDEFFVRTVEGIRMISPDRTEYTEAIPGLCIRRDRFDQHLASMAEEAGADLRLENGVRSCSYEDGRWMLATRNDDVEASILVGADGPRSFVGRCQGLDVTRRMAMSTQYKFKASGDLSDDHLRFYVGQDYRGGYGWSFDRGSEVNIGVITKEGPRRILDQLCKDLGLDVEDRISKTGGMIPQGGPNPVISARAMVIVGDAAGLINPCSAGGIHAALHSGRVAAEHVLKARESDDPGDLSGYEKEIRSTPFCDPMLKDARVFMDELTDEQWDFIIKTIRERDVSRLMSVRSLSRLIVNSPFALPQLWSLRALGKAFRSYGTWGW